LTPQQAFCDALATAFGPGALPQAIGVAVSGGGDSMAALAFARDWAAPRRVAVHAVTVDHGLRAGAADEARAVAQFCAARGIAHDTLRWQGWDGRGNLQAAARDARYRLIADWARRGGMAAVVLGHTRDDQAETVLLRLARGSGVDGLSGMAAQRMTRGLLWLRPLLGVRRAALRAFLRAEGIGWFDDPSNDDPRFDRVRARAALASLAPLGIDAEGLAATAERLQDARAALEAVTAAEAGRLMRVEAGDVVIRAAPFGELPRAVRERMIAHALCWISTAPYRPRHAALRALSEGVLAGRSGTLHGCLVTLRRAEVWIGREPQAVAGHSCPVGRVWDNRWRLTGPEAPDAVEADDLTIAALGDAGLGQCPGWRATGLPRASVMASPAVWRGATLVAAPLAGRANGWVARLEQGTQGLFKMALSD
jgi:tRNA(Ile)-lysidine synthase